MSHLGTVRVAGAGSIRRSCSASSATTCARSAPGRAQYTHLLDEADGSVVDDIIVWWLAEDAFDVMPNASNTDRVQRALGGSDATCHPSRDRRPGPDARQLLAPVAPEAAAVGAFRGDDVRRGQGHTCTAAGTGYTGEDGVECAVPTAAAPAFWQAVVDTGMAPAGLGARDTLRLEAGLPLHGHELGPGITPLEAGLGWVVGWDKDDFRGRPALERRRERGPGRTPAGPGGGRAPAAPGRVRRRLGHVGVGTVTSGNFSPVLDRGIAMAFVDHAVAATDDIAIDVRGRRLAARSVPLPFVARGGRGAAGERR